MKEEEGKEKINLTDRDANHMKAGGSKDIRPGYNLSGVSDGERYYRSSGIGNGSERP